METEIIEIKKTEKYLNYARIIELLLLCCWYVF